MEKKKTLPEQTVDLCFCTKLAPCAGGETSVSLRQKWEAGSSCLKLGKTASPNPKKTG
jgi:hypothetical protein